MWIAIIATKDNAIIANIALEYFTVVNGAQHHPTRVLYMKLFLVFLVRICWFLLFVDAYLLCKLNPTVLRCNMLQYSAIYYICDIIDM